MSKMYPFYSAIFGCLLAQLLKPVGHYLIHQEWKPHLVFASGGMPSSHSALVSALTLSIGIVENFDSSLFAVTLAFSVIICYDAANVRYYAGQNISLTKKLINDLKEITTLDLPFADPIYQKKMKEVIGHTYFEVFFGILTGLVVSYVMFLIYR